MSLPRPNVPCPFCKEMIHPDAVKCRFCQSELKSATKKRGNPLAKYLTFRNGFLIGVLFTIVVGVLIYSQFYME